MSGAGSANRSQAALLNEEMLDVSHAGLQGPLGLSLGGEYGFREKPVNCQSTSLRVANLHLENHFTQRKRVNELERRRPAGRGMVRRKGNMVAMVRKQGNKTQTEVGGTWGCQQ